MPSEKQSKINRLRENRLMKGLVAHLIVIKVSISSVTPPFETVVLVLVVTVNTF